MAELCRSELTGNVYCVTAWKVKPTKENPYGQAKTKHDVTDSFEQVSRREWEPMYHLLRRLFQYEVLDAGAHGFTDEKIAEVTHLKQVREELIRFGHPDWQADLEAEDWVERVRKWEF